MIWGCALWIRLVHFPGSLLKFRFWHLLILVLFCLKLWNLLVRLEPSATHSGRFILVYSVYGPFLFFIWISNPCWVRSNFFEGGEKPFNFGKFPKRRKGDFNSSDWFLLSFRLKPSLFHYSGSSLIKRLPKARKFKKIRFQWIINRVFSSKDVRKCEKCSLRIF